MAQRGGAQHAARAACNQGSLAPHTWGASIMLMPPASAVSQLAPRLWSASRAVARGTGGRGRGTC